MNKLKELIEKLKTNKEGLEAYGNETNQGTINVISDIINELNQIVVDNRNTMKSIDRLVPSFSVGGFGNYNPPLKSINQILESNRAKQDGHLEYEGDKGFNNKYIDIKYLNPYMLKLFVDEHKRRHGVNDSDIDLDKCRYLEFMFRRDGYLHNFAFRDSNKDSDRL